MGSLKDLSNITPAPPLGQLREVKSGFTLADLIRIANAPRDWWISHGLPVPKSPLNMATLTPGNIPGQIANTVVDAGRGAVNTAVDMGHMPDWSPMQLGMMMATAGQAPNGIRAYHGSPYDFNKFDISKIGTGEGAQAYGHGLYFAENKGVARSYRDTLANDLISPESAAKSYLDAYPTREDAIKAMTDHARGGMGWSASEMQNLRSGLQMLKSGVDVSTAPRSGRLYEVSINAHPDEFLNWDKPLSEQPQKVQEAVAPVLDQIRQHYGTKAANDPLKMSGEALYRWIGDSPEATQALQAAGIKGIRYLDQGSRGSGSGTSNYVVFNPEIIDILKKYGIAGLTAGGLGAAAVAGGTPQQAKAATP